MNKRWGVIILNIRELVKMSDKEQNTREERKPYLKVAPVPRIVRFAGGLIKTLSLILIGYTIFITIWLFVTGVILEPGTCCAPPLLILMAAYFYNCGRRMQSGISDFIYGLSAIGLTLIIASIIFYYKSEPLGAAIFMGIAVIFFIFPITVALLNWKNLR